MLCACACVAVFFAACAAASGGVAITPPANGSYFSTSGATKPSQPPQSGASGVSSGGSGAAVGASAASSASNMKAEVESLKNFSYTHLSEETGLPVFNVQIKGAQFRSTGKLMGLPVNIYDILVFMGLQLDVNMEALTPAQIARFDISKVMTQPFFFEGFKMRLFETSQKGARSISISAGRGQPKIKENSWAVFLADDVRLAGKKSVNLGKRAAILCNIKTGELLLSAPEYKALDGARLDFKNEALMKLLY